MAERRKCVVQLQLQLQLQMVVIAAAMAVGASACSSSGLNYTVGDDLHWTIPPAADFYANWSSTYFFKIGDSLYFEYEAEQYNVIQVGRQEYDSCTACNPIRVFTNTPPAIFPLNHTAIFYFISNISNYCHLGLKLSVTVHNCPGIIIPKLTPPPPPFIPHSPSSPAPAAPISTVIASAPSPPPAHPPEISMARFDAHSVNGMTLISFVLLLNLMISVIVIVV